MGRPARDARSGDYSHLAGSLATVAIAALGGPLAAGGTALAEVVKHAQARYEADAPTRHLRTQVAAEIRQWAQSESFAAEDIELGLMLATDTVAQFGPEIDTVAALQFDPAKVSELILRAAAAHDPYWGTERHYRVAVRALDVTYGVLIRRFKADADSLLPAILALHRKLDHQQAEADSRGHRAETSLEVLTAAVAAAGTAAEVKSYLRSRIADWDLAGWHPKTPSTVEQLLVVRTVDGGEPDEMSSAANATVTAAEALAGQRMLVVLGGPGSGKTWLARRYAREAAQTALTQLEHGARLEDVELPLLTTWDQWAMTAGSTRQSLIAASFAAGLGRDPDGTDSVDRLQRTFTSPAIHVLMVIDSLDEAADVTDQAAQLREVSALQGWRVVITSRPAAWDIINRARPGGSHRPRVVRLQDLVYPVDVEAFIRAWFASDPGRGDALAEQLARRHNLSRDATVPLMLTFYCLLSEHPALEGRPLPARRQELYRRLVRRLLLGRWAANPGPDAAPDFSYCESLLTGWAWHAVRDRKTSNGIGYWGDSFTQPTTPRQDVRRAVDHLAPKVTQDEDGEVSRRFVHRTFLEHFVAEHIATLNAQDAADVLLPHLWFDPDWQTVVPAAVAAHNQRQPGLLLELLLPHVLRPAADMAHQYANLEIDHLLLNLAEQTHPDDWTPTHQELIDQCRVRKAILEPSVVARSAHWTASNQAVRSSLLTTVTGLLAARAVGGIVEALPEAASAGAGQKEALRAALTTTVYKTAENRIPEMVKTLSSSDMTEGERAGLRAKLVTGLTEMLEGSLSSLSARAALSALATLNRTYVERAEVRVALLKGVRATSPQPVVRAMAKALPDLVTGDADEVEARAALMELLRAANATKVFDLAHGLGRLDPTHAERIEVGRVLLRAIAGAGPGAVGDTKTTPTVIFTADERPQARAEVMQLLREAGPRGTYLLAQTLSVLDPTDADRAQCRTALLEVLPIVEPCDACSTIEALPALIPTAAEQAVARTTLMQLLSTSEPHIISRVVKVLTQLNPTATEQGGVRATLLQRLADQPEMGLATALSLLNPPDDDSERADQRATLLNALRRGRTGAADTLVSELAKLNPSKAEQADARAALLNMLRLEPPETGFLAAALTTLDPTAAEQAEARTAVRNSLLSTPYAALMFPGAAVSLLRYLSPLPFWLAWLSDPSS